ncbi:MAG: sigma-54 dependent transcriptional regulator [Myxococcota bacterium]
MDTRLDPPSVLVVEDEPVQRALITDLLVLEGFTVQSAVDAAAAWRVLEHTSGLGVDAVILDVNLPVEGGLQLLPRIRALQPHLSVIVVTASATVDQAVFALKNGAVDYLVKPLLPEALSSVVRNAVERTRMGRELAARRAIDVRAHLSMANAVFASPAMESVLRMVEHVKDSSVPVLITGESGTGKEIVARLVHQLSHRRDKPFVAINCATLPQELAESELFGHERGAFTSAHTRRQGRFEEAGSGTVFLDEAGELNPLLQAKLLRVLQEREFTRVGGTTIRSEARVLVATHRDLRAEVKAGRFREDLYYRLDVVTLHLPPLRERRAEIPVLAVHLLRRFAQEENRPEQALSADAVKLLQAHTWPGNVRELENVLKRSALMCRETVLTAEDLLLPVEMRAQVDAVDDVTGEWELDGAARTGNVATAPVRRLRDEEAQLMMRALAETGGNVSEAARLLGIGRATFYRRAKRYQLPI